MSFLKTSLISLLLLFFLAIFSNCSSSKDTKEEANKQTVLKFQEKPSFTLENMHFQKWVARTPGEGSWIHMYITVKSNKNNVAFDSVYFRGMQSKIARSKMGYIASFKTEANLKEDIIMSNEEKAEYANKIPITNNFAFDLKDNECVISYIEDHKTKFFKIENLVEKPSDK